MPLAKHRLRSPPAECLKPKGPGAGEEVDRHLALHPRADQVEERLADPVFHRAGAACRGKFERAAAQVAPHDPWGTGGLFRLRNFAMTGHLTLMYHVGRASACCGPQV